MALTRVGSKGIAVGAIDPNDIAANAITEAKIASNAVESRQIAADSVVEAKIADSAVTPNKISGQVPVSKGGTGAASLTTDAVLLGNGTGSVNTVSAGDLGNVLTSSGTAWISKAISAGGNLVTQIYTSNTTWTKPDNLKAIKVTVVGGGGGTNSISTGPGTPAPTTVSTGGTGATSSFGSFASATGGGGGLNNSGGCTPFTSGGRGGVGAGGNVIINGEPSGPTNIIRVIASSGPFALGGFSHLGGAGFPPGFGNIAAGIGAGGTLNNGGPLATPGGGGGGGGACIVYLPASDIPGPVTVTVGTGGAVGVGFPAPLAPGRVPSVQAGGNGVVIVEEFY